MQSESPEEVPIPPGIGRLVLLAKDPRMISFLLVVLVLDAVGVLPQVLAYAGGIC